MNRSLVLLAVLLLTACAPSLHPSERPEQLSYPPLEFHVPTVEKISLPNGIRLYLQEDHELPLVAVTAMFAAGSIGDPPDRVGQTGMLASLMRTGGTEGLAPDEVDARLEYYAIDLTTHADSYAVSFDMSLRSADLSRGLGLFGDLLRHPRFDPERLELLRRQAQEAVRRQNDDPGSIAQRALDRALFPDHPFGRSATIETLNAISREDLLAQYLEQIRPDTLWLAVTGDFQRSELLVLLDELFGDWPVTGRETQSVPPLPRPLEPAVWLARKDIPQTTILIGQVGINKDDPELFPVRVMNYILGGGGFNSRLMREVRSNRGLAYSVYSYYRVGRKLPEAFIASCETKNASTLEVVKLMQHEMERIRREPVGDEELRLAKESLINSFVFAFDDVHDVVTQSMRLDLYDYPDDYLQSYRDKIAAVTTADVLQAARDYLDPQKQSLVLVGNPDEFGEPLDSLGLPVIPVVDAP